MNDTATLSRVQPSAMRICANGYMGRILAPAATLAVVAAGIALPRPALAVDGCLVLLCLAAPSWRAIPQCVPPITQVLRDLARGRPFPTCGMAGPGNSASHQWASAPGYCPQQYTRAFDGVNGLDYSCDFTGAVTVNIEGAAWARTWWNMGGDSVTEYLPAAKARLGSWDTRFDTDLANWASTLPPAQTPCWTC